MKYFCTVVLTLILAAPTFAAERLFSEQQTKNIEANGLWLLGKAEQPSAELQEYLREHEDSEFPILKCGTPMLMDLKMVANLDRHSHTAAMVANPRPDSLDLTYDSPGGQFKIHYTKTGTSACYQPTVDTDGDGVPNYIETMAIIADSVHNQIVNVMGYPPPPEDSFYVEGGDERYDIYVRNLPSTIYGQTVPDSISLAQGTDAQRATSFMELDNDYSHVSAYRDRPLDAVRVTVAHEYFHSVQFSIDYFETDFVSVGGGLFFAARYWMEMSAVWMEEALYDELNDYYFYLPVFYNAPQTSFQRFNTAFDLHPYASCVLPIYLDQRFGPEIIRDIWLRCGEMGPGPDFLAASYLAIDSVSGGTMSWPSAFQEFALWNYFTGERAAVAPAGIGYEEADAYPEIPEDKIGRHFSYPVSVTSDANPYIPQHNAAAYMRFENVANTMTRFWTCTAGSFGASCTDSIEVFDTTGWDPFSEFNRIDTGFSVRLRYGRGEYVPWSWGLSVVTQLDSDPDNYTAEQFLLPHGDSLNFVTVETLNQAAYRSILYILSWGTPIDSFYTAGLDTNRLSYAVRETSTIDSARVNIPSVVLTPYPNPAVVAEMSSPEVWFRFNVATDSLAAPLFDFPLMVVDVFSIAGEYIATVERVVTDPYADQNNRGEFRVSWDMKNSSGKHVASGAYIAFARLYSDSRRSDLLAEDRVKVAIIR